MDVSEGVFCVGGVRRHRWAYMEGTPLPSRVLGLYVGHFVRCRE